MSTTDSLPHRGPWEIAYDLAADERSIALVQRATLTTAGLGLLPDVALYGSADWWAAIADGRIPKHEARGIISRVFMTGDGGWPEFELDSGEARTRWTRRGSRDLYVEGREAKVEYVLQRPRTALFGGAEQREVLRVLIRR